ncbi:MYXO-CTERM sorting domain-containing protein [Paraliomyxa miuraensis]|uniref:MYXO-CTERM sorting domain-containing protein n=1 Tax=Paraliomyxa miuraensis TaxID=376150 RepID=UPI00224E1879|nr:MYXO-CTERM sorting domain-containing protein [Paraliomyxa miuraensis]MCX4244971.1 MYXO-CTERM sorting domain-containing protein [Paraliomyxa miuraensis]
MDLHRKLPLLASCLVILAAPRLAAAATANCMSADGMCSVSNDGFDWIDCTCADGSGGGGGGGNMWAGLTEMELQPICEDQLANFCGPFVPPDYVECWGVLGSCIIDNEPEDSLECWCLDGSSGGVAGGMAWAGYDDVQLAAECEAQLDMICVPPPGSVVCNNGNGECTIANVPSDLLACQCANGDGGGFGGGNMWAGYSELELHTECGTQLVGLCGGPLPPPPWVECSSRLGECIIDNDPEDLLECTCTDGTEINSSGGGAWAGLSNDELFLECEMQLYEGCWVGVGSESGTDTGEPGDTGDTGTTGTTGAPGSTSSETGVDDSGGTSEGTSGTPPPHATGDESTGSDPGADDEGTAGGCGCTAADRSAPEGWALMLLGVLGMGWRRRRGLRRVR